MRQRTEALHIKEFTMVEENYLTKLDITDPIFGNSYKKPVFIGDIKTYPSDETKHQPYINEEEDEKEILSNTMYKLFGIRINHPNPNYKSPLINYKKGRTLHRPNYLGNEIYFSEKALFRNGLIGNKLIKPLITNKIMNMNTFLGQFYSLTDINKVELLDIIDIDNVELQKLKEKSVEFVDAASNLDNEDVLIFFNEKLQELKQNEINIQIFIQNIDKIKGIKYEKDGVIVYFKVLLTK